MMVGKWISKMRSMLLIKYYFIQNVICMLIGTCISVFVFDTDPDFSIIFTIGVLMTCLCLAVAHWMASRD